MTNKTQLRAAYIAELQATYPFYVEGSRPLELANLACDKVFGGKLKLDGASWTKALISCGLPKNIAMRDIAALPEDY